MQPPTLFSPLRGPWKSKRYWKGVGFCLKGRYLPASCKRWEAVASTAAELRALVEAKLQGQAGEAATPATVIPPLQKARQPSVTVMSPPTVAE